MLSAKSSMQWLNTSVSHTHTHLTVTTGPIAYHRQRCHRQHLLTPMHHHPFFWFIPFTFAGGNPSAVILSAFPFLCFVPEEGLDPTGAERRWPLPKPITERAMGIALYKEQTLDAQRPCASFPCASPLEGSLICVCLCVGVREAPGDDTDFCQPGVECDC